MAGKTRDKDEPMAKITMNRRIQVILVLLTGWLPVAAFLAHADDSDWVWSSTSMLRKSRTYHIALPVDLPGNVKGVMVIGGATNEKFPSAITGSELYFPRQKEDFWSPGPILHTPRTSNTATVLTQTTDPKKGSVLVAGGTQWEADGNLTSLAGCEFLNPKPKDNNATTTAGDMRIARANHMAVELNDGQVLVAGGERWDRHNPKLENPEFLKSSELYDPRSNVWTPTKKSLNKPRSYGTAVLLTKGPNKGKVLVVGGIDSVNLSDLKNIYSPALASCELYNPADQSWKSAGSLKHPRVNHTLTVMDDGRVLAAGGQDQTGANAAVYRTYEIYNALDGNATWSCPYDKDIRKHLREGRSGHTATLLKDGTVLLTGNYTSEVYHPEKDTWTFTRDTLWYPRTHHTATRLDDENGTVLVAGGLPNLCEKYEPPSASRFLKSGVARPVYRKGARNNVDNQE
jgi:hypothetical protein